MEEAFQLIARNAALGTELRMIREQLSQANSANQYLLQRLSTTTSGADASKSRALERQLEAILGENGRLRDLLHHRHRLRSPRALLSNRRARAEKSRATIVEDPVTSYDCAFGPDTEPEDLISLHVDLGTPTTLGDDSFESTRPAANNGVRAPRAGEVAYVTPEKEQEPEEPSIGIGICANNTSDSDPFISHPSASNQGFRIVNTDGSFSFIPTPALPSSSTNSEPRIAPPFTDSQHRRLRGLACFVEEYTEDEKISHWEQHARKFPRHTAEEYEAYYRNIVLPKYREEMKQRAESSKVNEEKSESFTTEATGSVTSHGSFATQIDGINVQPPIAETIVVPVDLSFQHSLDSAETLKTDEAEDKVQRKTEQVVKNDPVDASPCREMPKVPRVPSRAAITSNSNFDKILGMAPTSRDCDFPLPQQPPMSEEFSARFGPSTLDSESPRAHHQKNAEHKDPLHGPWFPPRSYREPHIVFRPEDHDIQNFRTAVITNIPMTTTLNEVLDTVREGKIDGAHLLETSKMKINPRMDTNAALVTFYCGWQAQNFVTRCQSNPISFPSKGSQDPVVARVAFAETPTHPLHPVVRCKIREYNRSRVLSLHGVPSILSPAQVVQDIMNVGEMVLRPLRLLRDLKGVIVLQLASIAEAVAALETVRRNPKFFVQVTAMFCPDPCDAPDVEIDEEHFGADGEQECQGGKEAQVGKNKIVGKVGEIQEDDECDEHLGDARDA